MKASVLIFLIIILVILLIAFIVFNVLNRAKITEFIEPFKFSREQYLSYNILYPTLEKSDKYVFRISITNNFEDKAKIKINSKLFSEKILIEEKEISDSIDSKLLKSYDISFHSFLDNSKISNINFCEKEDQNLECSKNKKCSIGACLYNCKCYTLDSEDKNKNLYCYLGARIESEIVYSSVIKNVFSLSFDTKEERKKLSIDAPFEIYVYVSPTPFNNLLPITFSFEIRGYDLKINYIKIRMLNYSITRESFFIKRKESIDTSQQCYVELNREVNGVAYFSKENGFDCTFQPVDIIIEEKEKKILDINNKSKEIINTYCKNKNLSECAKTLRQKSIEICNLYKELEICKEGENLLREYRFLIEIGFEKTEKFKKTLTVGFC